MSDGPEDISEEFKDDLKAWTDGMCKMLSLINRVTDKQWLYIKIIYDELGEVKGCQLYGNSSEDVDAVRH